VRSDVAERALLEAREAALLTEERLDAGAAAREEALAVLREVVLGALRGEVFGVVAARRFDAVVFEEDAGEPFTKRTGFFAREAVDEEGLRFLGEAIVKSQIGWRGFWLLSSRRSATRKRALRLRGFTSISSLLATMGLRVTSCQGDTLFP
jgi:hypothetical protein